MKTYSWMKTPVSWLIPVLVSIRIARSGKDFSEEKAAR